MIQLTDEEIDYQIDYAFKHNDLPLEVLLRPLIQSSIKAQLNKVLTGIEYRYGVKGSGGHSRIVIDSISWQALLEEVKGGL